MLKFDNSDEIKQIAGRFYKSSATTVVVSEVGTVNQIERLARRIVAWAVGEATSGQPFLDCRVTVREETDAEAMAQLLSATFNDAGVASVIEKSEVLVPIGKGRITRDMVIVAYGLPLPLGIVQIAIQPTLDRPDLPVTHVDFVNNAQFEPPR